MRAECRDDDDDDDDDEDKLSITTEQLKVLLTKLSKIYTRQIKQFPEVNVYMNQQDAQNSCD